MGEPVDGDRGEAAAAGDHREPAARPGAKTAHRLRRLEHLVDVADPHEAGPCERRIVDQVARRKAAAQRVRAARLIPGHPGAQHHHRLGAGRGPHQAGGGVALRGDPG